MTKLKRYPEYKASGIEWIGDVPSGWEVKPFFAHAQERKAKNTGMIENNLLSLSYGNIVRRDIESNMGLLPESFETYQIVEPDDTVFRLTDLQNDQRSLRTGFVRERGIITSAYTACYFKGISPKYINRLMHAYDLLKVFYGMGGGLRQSLKYSDLRRIPLILPPPPEQQAIADFLDRETAHIDAVITKKTRLIELLKEKRQATITHTVIKGLDPQSKLKNSGIEWIGAIPEGWEVKPFRYFSLFRRGLPITKEDLHDTGIPTLNYGEIHSKYPFEVSPEKHFLKGVQQDFLKTHKMSLLKHGDFVFADTSEDLEGSGNFSYFNSTCMAFAGYHTIIVSLDFDSHERFFAYLFDSQFFRKQIVDKVRGIKVFSITQEILKSTSLLVPSLPEQQAIADYLDKQCAAIDAIITKTQRSIELLKEKRQTLITAAVTGQIDVRSW